MHSDTKLTPFSQIIDCCIGREDLAFPVTLFGRSSSIKHAEVRQASPYCQGRATWTLLTLGIVLFVPLPEASMNSTTIVEGPWSLTILDGWFICKNIAPVCGPFSSVQTVSLDCQFSLNSLVNNYACFGLLPKMADFSALHQCCAVLSNYGCPKDGVDIIPQILAYEHETISLVIKSSRNSFPPGSLVFSIFFIAGVRAERLAISGSRKAQPGQEGDCYSSPAPGDDEARPRLARAEIKEDKMIIRGTAKLEGETFVLRVANLPAPKLFDVGKVELKSPDGTLIFTRNTVRVELVEGARVSFKVLITLLECDYPAEIIAEVHLTIRTKQAELVLDFSPPILKNSLGCMIMPILMSHDRILGAGEVFKLRLPAFFHKVPGALGNAVFLIASASRTSRLHVSPRIWYPQNALVLPIVNHTHEPFYLRKNFPVAAAICVGAYKLRPLDTSFSIADSDLVFLNPTTETLVWGDSQVRTRESGIVRLHCHVRALQEYSECPMQVDPADS